MIGSITQKIRKSSSVEQVRELINYANWSIAGSSTSGLYRREFLRVAKQRIKELEQARI